MHKEYQYRWVLSQSIPYDDFEFVEDLSIIPSEFIMNYDIKDSICYILMIDFDHTYNHCTEIYHFSLKREKLMEGLN